MLRAYSEYSRVYFEYTRVYSEIPKVYPKCIGVYSKCNSRALLRYALGILEKTRVY